MLGSPKLASRAILVSKLVVLIVTLVPSCVHGLSQGLLTPRKSVVVTENAHVLPSRRPSEALMKTEDDSRSETMSAEVKVIYYINLQSSVDRLQHMKNQFRSTNFSGKVVRQKAVTGEDVAAGKANIGAFKGGISTSLHSTAVACFLSHFRTLEKVSRTLKPHEAALILEDDVDIPTALEEKLRETLLAAPPDWDILKVCGWGNTRTGDLYNSDWYTAQKLWDGKGLFYAGSCGYIVSGASAHRVVQHLLRNEIVDFDAAIMSDLGKVQFAIRTYQMRMPLIKLHGIAPKWFLSNATSNKQTPLVPATEPATEPLLPAGESFPSTIIHWNGYFYEQIQPLFTTTTTTTMRRTNVVETFLSQNASAGATVLQVYSDVGFQENDIIAVGLGTPQVENATIDSLNGSIIIEAGLKNDHAIAIRIEVVQHAPEVSNDAGLNPGLNAANATNTTEAGSEALNARMVFIVAACAVALSV